MTQLSVKVVFSIQGNSYEVSASTLFDPAAGTGVAGSSPAL
jgi:hypothetical protein